ncbi:MAG: hypothetical protein QXE31_01075 [Candidatus Woesearchaeota archaeon]
MKNIFFYVFSFFVFLVFVFSFVKAEDFFYEDFSDENINEGYLWKTRNNAYYFENGKLNADGISDNVGRYFSQFDYFFNFSTEDFVFSFEGLLKSNGNPQEGKGITASLVGNNARYDLRILNGQTSGFPLNYYTISLGYGDTTLHDLITTNFIPSRDVFYNVKAVRINWTWYLFVNGELIGQAKDNLKITDFIQIHIPCVGSIIIDNINISSIKKSYMSNLSQESTEFIDEGLLKYAPVFYLHPNEYYEPKEIESMLNLSFLKNEKTIVKENPIYYFDIENLSSDYYLDLQNVDIETELLPKISDFDVFKPVIYGRAIYYNNHSHYQYFIFYPFQKRGIMSHEGDWELVQVNVDSAEKIESVHYYFDMFSLAHYNLEDLEFVNQTHPVVYVALGSHNNYAHDKEIVFENPYVFFQKFFADFKKLEKISKNGIVYKPNNLEILNEKEKQYEIKNIYDIPYDFKGYWGQITNKVLKQSPKSPKYDGRFYKIWREPETFAYAPDFPFFSVFLYSPVNFEILDKENNQINDINEKLLFLNYEPKSAIIKGNNYNLKLKSNDSGQFSLDVYLYDNETNKGIMVSYKNITTEMCSKGYLNASFDSYFVLYYDSNCDEIYEKYFPNENITLNFDYTLPDKDEDGINDFVDNCVDKFNPDQKDFNNNGFGDACDNPRYYKIKALELLKNIERDSKKENHSYYAINKSLILDYWFDEFRPKTIKVFLYELFAVQHINNTEIEYLLAKADKLILEKLFEDYEKESIKHKRNFKIGFAKKEYEEGLKYFEKNEYKKSILSFMKAWNFLN